MKRNYKKKKTKIKGFPEFCSLAATVNEAFSNTNNTLVQSAQKQKPAVVIQSPDPHMWT